MTDRVRGIAFAIPTEYWLRTNFENRQPSKRRRCVAQIGDNVAES